MALKTLQCRTHSGTFQVEARRGRPPVSCSIDNPCSRTEKAASKRRVAEALEIPEVKKRVNSLTLTEWRKAAKEAGFSAAVINKMRTPAMFRQLLGSDPAEAHTEDLAKREPRKAPESASEPPTATNPSLVKATQAKSLLEAQGWVCSGKGRGTQATLTASRGEETLILNFRDGELVDQNYMLWNTEKPSANGMPNNKLTFDPDEMTDSELIRALSGMKVTWWNRLASNTETAIVSGTKIQIEHNFAGNGDETPADRIVKFIDHGGKGFRNFRVGALLKVG